MDGIYTVHRTYMYMIFLYNFECEEFITNKLETKSICLYFLGDLRRCGLVVMDFDCYTGDRGLIPTHGDIGNIGIFLRNLRSYFVVKSLHFLKESKYFSLFSSTTKLENHEKIEKMYL